MARRAGVGVASALSLLALAWPAFAPGELDSLPLSNYPMFAHERERVTHFYAVVRVDEHGEEHRLGLRMVGGTDQPVQAAMTVQQAVSRGEADDYCAEVAERVDAPGMIQVLSLRYDAPGWFRGRQEPVRRTVHAECDSEGDGR